jgi:hypothetical protein
MKKAVMLAAVLLLSAAWLQAQQQDPQGSGSETTVQGCLQGSSGNFTLTDKSGTTYQLAGDTSKLTEHVGHEVQIKGMTSPSAPSAAGSSSSNPSGSSAAGGSQPNLTVKEVKHVSKTCTSSAK